MTHNANDTTRTSARRPSTACPLFAKTTLAAAVAAAALALAGCAGGGDKNAESRKLMKEQWQAARVNVVYQMGTQQYEAGEFDKCRETISGALTAGAPYAPLCVLAAKLEIEKGNLETAFNHLKTAQSADPTSPEAYYYMGVVYQRWLKHEQALENYRGAWERKASEPGYLLAVVEMLITLGKLDEAQALLEAKIDFFEQTAAVRVAMAKVYALRHDHVTASRYYRDAVILSPDDLALRLTYAESLYFAGKYADALPVLEDLRRNKDLADKATVTMLLGRTYMGLHRSRDARLCFQDLTQDNPSNTVAWLSLGRVYLQENEPVLAIQTAQRVLKAEPASTQAMIIKALAEQKQKRWKDAEATLEAALQVNPKDSTVLCMLGVSAMGQGEKDRAAGFYERAVAANPNDAWAAELLASVRPAKVEAAPALPDRGEAAAAVAPGAATPGGDR
jgi:tetratricopeptide (TPR) repeat protein